MRLSAGFYRRMNDLRQTARKSNNLNTSVGESLPAFSDFWGGQDELESSQLRIICRRGFFFVNFTIGDFAY